MLERFLNYLRFEKKFSRHTLVSYENDLNQFTIFLKKIYEVERPEEASSSMVRSWMAQMMQDKITSRSVTRKASALRTFYRFLLKEGVISIDPMVKIIDQSEDCFR